MDTKTRALTVLMTAAFMTPAQARNNDSSGMNHSGTDHVVHEGAKQNKDPEASIKLSVTKIEDKGDLKVVQIRLAKMKDDSPVTLDNLKEIHTQKFHLLIIDDGLEDYAHVHPKATTENGVYEFEWRPTKKNSNYRIWADLFPLDTNVQEYVMGNLTTNTQPKPEINRAVSLVSTVEGLTFKLSFDPADLQAGRASMGKIMIVDDKGRPITSLEPIMGSFAHIVGFGDDLKSIVHIHPMGVEPTKDTTRGGPELQFHLEPEKAGFIKLFAQVKVNGKELYAPFGVVVKP